MKEKFKCLKWLVYVPLFLVFNLHSQTIEIKNIAIEDGNIFIRYDLMDSIHGRFYTVRLYSSRDDFLNPLNKLSGDAGMEISPGSGKLLVWDGKEELGEDFNGNVAIEIRARVYVPFINVDHFKDIKTLTRHRKHSITWTGGRQSNILNFNLYRGENKITTFSNIANVGHHDLEIPAHIKPGKGYYFVISDIKNKDEVVRTSEFKVARKIPLALKAIPGVLVASAAMMLSGSDAGGGNSLPDPITPASIQ